MLEYIPGNRTPSLTPRTDRLDAAAAPSPLNEASTSCACEEAARGESHRSGRHSFASAPHISRWRLAASMEIMIKVPCGTAMEDVCAPDLERAGKCKGRVVALVALCVV
jgi:hypothetical protein